MISKHQGLVLCAVALCAAQSARANNSAALMTSAEATESQAAGYSSHHSIVSPQQSGDTVDGPRGVSRAGLLSDFVGKPLPFKVTDFSMLMMPSVGSFSSAAPSSREPFSGFSVMHDLRVEFKVSDNVIIGPSVGMNEFLYTNPQGQFIVHDPGLLVQINNVNRARWGRARYRGSVWFTTLAPVSTYSRVMHVYTGISAAYIPVLHFQGSRFFLSGVASLKANFQQNGTDTGMIAPVSLVAAVQGNYRLARAVTLFAMDHVNTSAGPPPPMPVNAIIGPQRFRMQAKMAQMQSALFTDGIMTGAHFQVTPSVGISPRLDWQVNEPLNTTTLGLNAFFSLI